MPRRSTSRPARPSCRGWPATAPRQNYFPIYLSGDGGLAQDALIKDPNIKGEYAAIYSFPYTAKNTPATKEFHKAMDKYVPKVLKGNFRQPATHIWTAGKAMEAVAANITAPNPTNEDVLKGLYQIKDNDLGGLAPQPLTFTEGAESNPHISCYFTMQTKNHKISVAQRHEAGVRAADLSRNRS